MDNSSRPGCAKILTQVMNPVWPKWFHHDWVFFLLQMDNSMKVLKTCRMTYKYQKQRRKYTPRQSSRWECIQWDCVSALMPTWCWKFPDSSCSLWRSGFLRGCTENLESGIRESGIPYRDVWSPVLLSENSSLNLKSIYSLVYILWICRMLDWFCFYVDCTCFVWRDTWSFWKVREINS